jgi:hypothetical protein
VQDIRPELLERQNAAETRRAQAQAHYDHERSRLEAKYRSAMADFDRELGALKTLFEIEMRRHEGPSSLPAELAAPRLPLADFFITTLHSRGRLTKDELKAAAEKAGYFSDGESSGRATHTTLLNIVRAKKIVEDEDGVYAYPPVPGMHFGPPFEKMISPEAADAEEA